MASARTILRERLLESLSSITTAHGCKNDIGDIKSEAIAIDQFKNFPGINIEWGTEKYLNAEDPILNQDRKLHKQLSVFLDVFLKGYSDPYIAREDLIWDIKKVIMADYDLNSSCHSIFFVDTLDFGVESNKPIIGFSMELVIIYNTYMFNPSILA